jgi:hypothetical protein
MRAGAPIGAKPNSGKNSVDILTPNRSGTAMLEAAGKWVKNKDYLYDSNAERDVAHKSL